MEKRPRVFRAVFFKAARKIFRLKFDLKVRNPSFCFPGSQQIQQERKVFFSMDIYCSRAAHGCHGRNGFAYTNVDSEFATHDVADVPNGLKIKD